LTRYGGVSIVASNQQRYRVCDGTGFYKAVLIFRKA
jgi:hypothetical protein